MDFIIGNYSNQSYINELAPLSLEPEASQYLGNFRINKYELWFSDTINFIPYSGQPVFITDTSGNITHNGNLLTKGNTTIEKQLTVKNNTTLEKQLTVKDNTTIEKQLTVKNDLRVDGDLYINGQIFSAYLDGLIASIPAPEPASEPSTPTTPSTSTESGPSTPTTSSVTNITQIIQPIFDDVVITFSNAFDNSRNRGLLSSISFNGVEARATNAFQVGGMSTGKYVQSENRTGIEMLLTSNTSLEETDEGFVNISREENPGGSTGRISLQFSKPVREFSVKAVDAQRARILSGYRVRFIFANGLSQSISFNVPFRQGVNEFENTITKPSDFTNGDIREVILEPASGENIGSGYIVYTNLFWK